MNTEFWHKKWVNNDIPFNQKKTNPFMMDYFNTLNLKPGARIFVPLCGKSIDLIWLAEQGYEVIGIELNEQACIDFYKENNISYQTHQKDSFTVLSNGQITLLSGDFFALNKNIIGKIDAIYDRASLIALPSDARKLYAEKIVNLTQANTPVFLITASYNQQQMQGPPFSVDEHEIHQLYNMHFHIKTVHNKPAKNIPSHLKAKGLNEANDLVVVLLKK